MRQLIFGVATAFGVALLTLACGGSSGYSAPAASSTTAAASAATTAQPASGSVTVQVSSNGRLGTILTDAAGRTVYLRTNDEGSKSSCTADCAQNWPPLTVTGKPTAGSGIDGGLLATTSRQDGTTQVTLAGHPLYYFAFDKQSGDVNGEGVNAYGGLWYVVSPAGASITGAGAAPVATPNVSYPGY